MTSVNWVVGAGGLLGSAVVRELQRVEAEVFAGPSVRWGTSDASVDLDRGLSGLMRESKGQPWNVYWCAGAGVTGSDPEQFRLEIATFTNFLDSLSAMSEADRTAGSISIASSAGALYAGSTGAPFHEGSEVRPLGDYGQAKLKIEEAAKLFSEATGVQCMIARISNLYGPGQSLNKPQGLITHLCKSSLKRQPLSVFVPLDTLRDYIYVDDCAKLFIASTTRLRTTSSSFHIKVLASGRSVTVGALMGEFKRVFGRRPEIIMATSPQAALQSRDIRLVSQIWPDLDAVIHTNLADGIARTLQDLRTSFTLPSEKKFAD